MGFSNDWKRIGPVLFSKRIARIILVLQPFALITQIEYQVGRICVIQLEHAVQNRELALCACIRKYKYAVADLH